MLNNLPKWQFTNMFEFKFCCNIELELKLNLMLHINYQVFLGAIVELFASNTLILEFELELHIIESCMS